MAFTSYCPNQDEFISNCTCFNNGDRIVCDGIPLEEVAMVFAKMKPFQKPVELLLILEPKDIVIPDDFLGDDKFTNDLGLQCSSNASIFEVSANAFRSSKMYTTRLNIYYCNVELTDFTFLSSFINLREITFTGNVALQSSLQSLPYPLISLYLLRFFNTNLNGIVKLPDLNSGLGYLILENAQLDDDDASRILDWVFETSTATLYFLSFKNNYLKNVPSQTSKFTSVRYISMDNNQIKTLPTNVINFLPIYPDSWIVFSGNGLHTIEPNAFKGLLTSLSMFSYVFFHLAILF